jgi:hypothetical protein
VFIELGTIREESVLAYVGSEVLTAVVMRSSIFWHITPCSPLKINRRFEGICVFHLQSQRIIQARNQGKTDSNLATCFTETSADLNGIYGIIPQKIELFGGGVILGTIPHFSRGANEKNGKPRAK